MVIPTSANIKAIEEIYILDAFLSTNSDYELEEYPITSVLQKQLNPGDSVPDAIIKNKKTNERVWIEFTTTSTSQENGKKLRLHAKGKINLSGKLQGVININEAIDSLIYETSKAISKKNIKKYNRFSILANINKKGILICFLFIDHPFHNEDAHIKICTNFQDEHVLFSLDVGNSPFETIYLLANVMKHDGSWEKRLSLIASKNMISHLRQRQIIKEKTLNEINKTLSTHH